MKQNILGSVIKDVRKSKKITQSELSKLTGFSQNTISNHENGNRSLDEGAIKTYAAALNTTPEFLFEQLDTKIVKYEDDYEIYEAFGDIVKDKRKENGYDIKSFSEKIGVSVKKIKQIEAGNYGNIAISLLGSICVLLNISPRHIHEFLDHFESRDEYLETESMRAEVEKKFNELDFDSKKKVYNLTIELLKQQNNNVVSIEDYRTIQLQSKVSAGTGTVDLEPSHTETIEYSGKLPKFYDMAFQVDGNSMEPMFKDGDIIFVEKFEEAINGALMVVQIDDEAFVKKVYIEDDYLRLVSLNTDYKDILANGTNKIVIVGKVVF